MIARTGSPLGDDPPLGNRIVFEHHRVTHEVTGSTPRVPWRRSPQLSQCHTLLRHTASPPAWEGWMSWVSMAVTPARTCEAGRGPPWRWELARAQLAPRVFAPDRSASVASEAEAPGGAPPP